jgi:hypothetical protein
MQPAERRRPLLHYTTNIKDEYILNLMKNFSQKSWKEESIWSAQNCVGE